MACGTVAELTEWYRTYFFTHLQFACRKIPAKRCVVLHYSAKRDGGNQALLNTPAFVTRGLNYITSRTWG